MSNKLFVITGGPGSGKTTLLLELAQRGFRCSHEVARQIIQEQVAANGDANTPSSEIVFMDRGIPDVEAVATYEQMAEVYQEYGYRPIELPKASPPQRAEFVLSWN